MGRSRGQTRFLAHVVASAGRGARGPLSGHPLRYRPRHRKRILLRRGFPRPHHRIRPAPHRGQDDGARTSEGAAGAHRGLEGRRAQELHRKGRPLQMRADPRPAGRDDHLLYQRRFHRPLPGASPAQYRTDQGRQAHLRRRGLLARQREEQDAHAYLRHLVPQEVDARRIHRDDGGGQEARPPQAGQGARIVPLLAARGPGASALAPQGGGPARPAGAIPARRAEGVRIPAGNHPAYRQQGTLRHLGALRQIRQGLVPADPHARRERGVPAQTHELPASLRNI